MQTLPYISWGELICFGSKVAFLFASVGLMMVVAQRYAICRSQEVL
jgi:hypothetical protein